MSLVSLKKITYVKEMAKVIYHTKYNKYFGENVKIFTATDFIAELTQHIPPKGVHLIRYYGLYSSRTRGKMKKKADKATPEIREVHEEEHSSKESRKAWARLIQKVYEVDPLICPECESKMRIVAIIQDPYELDRIVKCLEKRANVPVVLEKAAV